LLALARDDPQRRRFRQEAESAQHVVTVRSIPARVRISSISRPGSVDGMLWNLCARRPLESIC